MAAPAIYNRPSLPSLLTEYGFDDQTLEPIKQTKVKERQKKPETKKLPNKKKSWDDTECDLEAAKARERDEHYEQMVQNLYKLRDYYYNEYSSLLADKVDKQRKDIRERDAIMKREREKKKEEERIASHQVKKRLERHTLESTPITAIMPKTDLYHIVGLEHKLRKQGKLCTVTEYNKFREDMHNPETFQSHFHTRKKSDSLSDPVMPDHQESQKADSDALNSSQGQNSDVFSLAPDPDFDAKEEALRSLSRISESQEALRSGNQENWAVTQQYNSMFKNQNRRTSNASQGAKAKSDPHSELEKRFPKLEMPKLHCFTMNLAQKPPDPEEVRYQLELRSREKQRKKMLRTKTKMYQLAMANSATSNRIMDQHENFDLMMNGPDLCDVIADHHWMQAYGLREAAQDSRSPVDWTEAPAVVEEEEEEEATHSSGTTETSKSSSKRSSAKSQRSIPAIEEARSPLPLTMNEIEDNSKIMEAKTMSTLWTNYLRAGKNSMKALEME